MTQLPLIKFSRLNDALEDVVFALGGWQPAAAKIWPSEAPTEKARVLRNSLNPDRRERLSDLEVEALIIAGSSAGCLTPLAYLNFRAGCVAPVRTDPAVQETEAVQAVQGATTTLQDALEYLEATSKRQVRAVK